MLDKKSAKPALLINLWLLFIIGLVVTFVFLNKPLFWIASNLKQLGFGLVFVISFSGIGSLLGQRLVAKQSRVDAFLLFTALGIGLTGLVVFLFGVFGIVNPALYSLWTLLGLILFIIKLLRQWIPLNFKIDIGSPFNQISIVILVLFILLALPQLVAPVSSTDAMEYHLLIPRTYLGMGRIDHIPSLLQASYPCLAQYIYTLIIPLAGDIACKTLHFWISILLLVSISRLTFKVNPNASRLLAPALFLSMPVFSVVTGWAWNDSFFVLFMVLSLGNLIEYHKRRDSSRNERYLFIAGIMAGLALWTKYTFIMVFVALLPLFIVGLKRWHWRFRHLLWFFLPLGVLSCLVFLKNYLFTGNPVYPFLNHIFPSPFWNEAATGYFTETLRRLDIPNWSWFTYLIFPFPLIIKPHMVDIHTGLMPLVLAPLAFLKARNRGMEVLKLFLLTSILSWLLFQTGTRSLLIFFAVLFCVAAIQLENLLRRYHIYRRAFFFLFSLIILGNLALHALANFYLAQPFRFFIGQEKKTAYLLREASFHGIYHWLNQNPQVKKVILVGFYDPYYLKKPYLFSSIGDPPIIEKVTMGAENSVEVWQKFTSLGITHLVLNQKQYEIENRKGLYSWPEKQKKAFEDFVEKKLTPVNKIGEHFIFKCKKKGS